MASIPINVGYRPLRIGFCVREGNFDDLRKAMTINTILWAGIHNPIIPIGKDFGFGNQLVDLFQVDLLHPIVKTPEIRKFISQHKYLAGPLYSEGLLLEETRSKSSYVYSLSALDISHPIENLWESEYKNTSKSPFILPEWDIDDPLHDYFLSIFGGFPNTFETTVKYKDAYLKALKAKPLKIGKTVQLSADLFAGPNPIDLTRYGVKAYYKSWLLGGVFLGNPKKFEDLVTFWNLRAASDREELMFVPAISTRRTKPFVAAGLTVLISHLRQRGSVDGLQIYMNRRSQKTLQKKAQELFPKQPLLFNLVDRHSWNGLNIRPGVPMFESRTIIGNLDYESGKPKISIQLPDKPAKFMRPHSSSQKLVVTFSPLSEHQFQNHTLSLPNLPELNKEFSKNLLPGSLNTLRVTPSNVGAIISLHEETFTVFPIDYFKLTSLVFNKAGIHIEQSNPGIVAQRIISQMGGLGACRVFKIRGVRKLIDSLDITDSIPLSLAERQIRDHDPAAKKASFDSFKSQFAQRYPDEAFHPRNIFTHLVEKRVFATGLELRCPNCEQRFWLSLANTCDEVHCEYCGDAFAVASQLKEKDAWSFRRSGLFGRKGKQEGAIPVILTLMQFSRLSLYNPFHYVTALNAEIDKLEVACEIDFVVIEQNQYGTISIGIGECKTNMEPKKTDIDRMNKICKELSAIDVTPYPIFSKTGSFIPTEIEKIRKGFPDEIKLILLSGKELEPYEPYEDYAISELAIPHKFVMSLNDMARNTQKIYLD